MNELNNTSIKAIIFDCDGTLADSEGAHFYAWQKVLLQRNQFFSYDDFLLCLGNANPTVAKTLAQKIDNASAEELLAERKAYYEEFIKKGHNPIQGTVNLASNLYKEKERLGIKLAVASAGKKDEVIACLKHLGIDHIFDAVITGQDDLHEYQDPNGVNKPSPYIYLHTAKVLKVHPSECVVIEDSLPGLTAGIKAGCFTIAIPTRSTQIQDLSSADICLKSFENVSVERFFQMVNEVIQDKKNSDKPEIIFLNGTSSAGKTSIIPKLQNRLKKPYMHVGIDHFFFMFPPDYIMNGSESHLGYCFNNFQDDDGPKISISKGIYAEKMGKVKLTSIQALLDQKFNLIIDEVLFAEEDFQDYLTLLKDYKVFFIAIKPSIECVVDREKMRNNRVLGLARGLYQNVYENKVYDLVVDNSFLTPDECAEEIVRYIQSNPTPKAFQQNTCLPKC